MERIAYKIEDAAEWAAARSAGVYHGSAVDVADGFIHLSSARQTRETAAKWFARREGLVLARVALDALGDTARWEASRGGALFPHIYGPLPMSAVEAEWPLALDADGRHIFPEEIA